MAHAGSTEEEAQRWRDAGLAYEEHEQVDDADLPPEVVAELDQELIDYWEPILLERLRRQSS